MAENYKGYGSVAGLTKEDYIEYESAGYQSVVCPVCGNHTLDSYFICPHCGWEYDGITEEDRYSPANLDNLKNYKNNFVKKRESRLNY